jgi:predicted transcriptional regulator of viral defense system
MVEALARLGISSANGSKLLRNLEKAGLVRRIRHGLWLLDLDADAFSIPPYLTAPFPAYVSLWSALSRNGMIEQIPRQVFVVSPDRPRTLETSLGTYSIHHIAPEVFGGYTGTAETGYIATPEKALFDTVYLPAARRRGLYLPELELPDDFDPDALSEWTSRIKAGWLRTRVARGLETVLTAVRVTVG